MAAIVVEFARFVEVRQRRARIAEAFIHPPLQAAVDTSTPVSVDSDVTELGVPSTNPAITREVVDVR